MQPTITILYGGIGSEREVSIKSGQAIAEALNNNFEIIAVELNKPELPENLNSKKTIIFPALHGEFGEDGQLQTLLEKEGFHYSGCDSQSSEHCFNKSSSKAILSKNNIHVPQSIVINEKSEIEADEITSRLGLPLIIKPETGGSSVGLMLVSEKAALVNFLNERPEGSWLIEQRIEGREITVGILEGKAQGIVEIEVEGELYDFKHKYTKGKTQFHCPANLPKALTLQITELSEKIFKLLECRDFGRIDFILSNNNTPYFLELNTIPGLTSTSLLPKSASCNNLNFEQLASRLVQPAIKRFQTDQKSA